jgi:hypothetical protein
MTGCQVQVVVDCADPHALAAWWAQTLDWRVEPQDPAFIQRMVDAGHATAEDTATYQGALVWKVGAAIVPRGDGEAAAGGPSGGQPRILFQLVPEAKSVKNRLHLDVRAGEDAAGMVARLTERGATVLHVGRQGPYAWTTMADPEGNEFCVQG